MASEHSHGCERAKQVPQHLTLIYQVCEWICALKIKHIRFMKSLKYMSVHWAISELLCFASISKRVPVHNLPHGNDFDLQDRQWTLKEHLFQYGKLWIKTCFETEVLKSKNNSKMTRWLKIIFALSSEQRFDTVELDLLSEVRGKDCWNAAVLWYKLHFYFVFSDFFLNFM